MTPDEFNRYCAEIMGYELMKMNRLLYAPTRDGWDAPELYDPATDLSQMAEVFDKLFNQKWTEDNWNEFSDSLNTGEGIAQAMREYIESTKEE